MSKLRGAPRKQSQQTINPKGTSGEKDNRTVRQSLPSPEVPPTPANTDQAKNPWYKSIDRWKAVLEVIAIPFAVGYAVVTYLQWRDLRHNFMVDQRAWIKVDFGVPVNLDPSMSVEVILHNTGKSPALRLEGNVIVQVVDANSSPRFPSGTVNLRKIVGNMLFPSDQTSFNSGRTPNNPDGTVRPLDTDELHRLSSGDAYLAIWGIIAYRDGFGDHWTRFCTWKTYQTSPKDFHIGGCVDWNSVGDGVTKWESPHG